MPAREVLPVERWAVQEKGDTGRFWLCDPFTGNIHNSNVVPWWVAQSRGIRAFPKCISSIRFLVAAETTRSDAFDATELAGNVSVVGWRYNEKDILASAAVSVAVASLARTFNTHGAYDPQLMAVRNTILLEANRYISEHGREQTQTARARRLAAQIHGMDALGWSMLANTGTAAYEECLERPRGDIDVLVGVAPDYLDAGAKSKLLGLSNGQVTSSYVVSGLAEPRLLAESLASAEVARSGMIELQPV